MDKQIENAIEDIDKILEGLRLLTDAIKNDVKLLELSLDDLRVWAYVGICQPRPRPQALVLYL